MGKQSKIKSAVKEMSFLDHLEELRWHLIRSTLAVVLIAVLAFIAKDFIFDVLLFGPKKADFPTYKLLCTVARFLGFEDSFCFSELPFRIQSKVKTRPGNIVEIGAGSITCRFSIHCGSMRK